MLVGSVGFLLSVGACAGIAVVGPVLEARGVPALLAVTLAAQAGVAPVMLPVFDGIPLASIPANLLAAPAAGPLMVWGLVAGLPAGLLGGPLASVLHIPTRLLVEWISGVARFAAALPLPEVGAPWAGAVVGATFLLWVSLGRRRFALVLVAVGVLASTIQATGVPSADESGRTLVAGVRMWRRAGAVIVVIHGVADEGRLLTAMRRASLRRVDILVVRSGGTGAARVVSVVRHRARVRAVLAPQGHTVPGALTASPGSRMRAGTLELVVRDAGPRLEVEVTSASP
jgi:competence protein ComEC